MGVRRDDSDDTGPPLSGWPPGTAVSLSRMPGPGQAMAKALGLCQLAEPVEVGRTLRVRLDSGRALAVSVVDRVEVIDESTLRIQTANHVYELRRIHGGTTSSSARLADHDAAFTYGPEGGDPSKTTVVFYEPDADARPGLFEEGAHVLVVQDNDGERTELGSCRLLGDLAPGEPLRLSTPEGVIGTSPVAKIARVEGGAVEVTTANSCYWLELEP